MFFGFGREEKGVENIQVEIRTLGVSFFCLGVLGAFYRPVTLYEIAAATCKASQPLEKSCLLVSKKIWNLKIQQSNQKLWLPEVSGALIGALSKLS